jgi:hAT family C-terminal dimerisation region
VPNQEERIERVVSNRGLRTFLVVDHTANLRKNSKISVIWHYLYVLDHLSRPAMATQCERVFSAAKRTLTPERNALGLNILKAYECLRWWWRNGVVMGIVITCPTATRVHTEAQLVTALLGDAGAVEEDID